MRVKLARLLRDDVFVCSAVWVIYMSLYLIEVWR